MEKSAFKGVARKDDSGFTILEVMIAIGIMAIGLLAISAMQIYAVRSNRTGNTFTQATALAKAQMEVLKNGNINNNTGVLNPAAFPTTTADPDNPLDENGDAGGIYTRTWEVDSYLADTDGDGIGDTASAFARTVTVTVTFPFVGGGTRSVSLSSVITGEGL